MCLPSRRHNMRTAPVRESPSGKTHKESFMKKVLIAILASIPALLIASLATLNPPNVRAVPSYARQTGLPCSSCHYNPPELNPAGRKFKLLGYVDKDKDKPGVTAEPKKRNAALDILASLPLSAMFRSEEHTSELQSLRHL